MDLREIGCEVWIVFDWLRTGTGGGLLLVRWWTFGFFFHGVSHFPSSNVARVKTRVGLHV
jgi:hypothetical protein